ncbi:MULTISPECIES: hypothetical protein [Legionella]|uniref:hypothetical protein n=1 Tax=Legionella TaxID=445 RepID=UPI001040ECA8|nr:MULTISPECIES: hypothetical protein [Legionella]
MSRLTISLPDNLHQRISALAMANNHSMSHLINQLIQVGLHHWFESRNTTSIVEQHCQQLIIQMSALIKNISVEMLKYDGNDFEKLQKAALNKLNELQNSGADTH